MEKIYLLFGEGEPPFRLTPGAAADLVGRRFPGVVRYRQFTRTADQLDGLTLAPYAASAELWLGDHAAAGELAGVLAAADEALPDVFCSRPALVEAGEEHNIMGNPDRDSGFKATFLFNRKASLPLAGFHRYWLEHHGPIAAKTQDAERYVQTHLSAPGRTYDGITELFWPDHGTAIASMASEQMRVDQANDAPNFVDGESLVVFLGAEVD